MKHFKDFIIRIQTFQVQHKQKNISEDSLKSDTNLIYYDVSNENPYLSQDFDNELKELTELAITDILTLSVEQIGYQLKRLEQVKTIFQKFWKKYYEKPLPFSDDNRKSVFYHLELNGDFMVHGTLPENTNVIITDQFLDDLCDSVQAKEAAVKKLEEAISKVISAEEKIEIAWATKYEGEKDTLSFKSPEIIEDFYNLLYPYFLDEDREQLANVLQTRHSETGLLLFNGFGNQLADAFKQLLDANLIVGCTPGELEKWILKYFLYRDKGKPKKFTEKYLNDIISSTTKQCQSPILDVKKKEDGQFGIFPAQRIKKNYKRY